jgi:imidazolonepropionase-like amidohydrolase
MIIRNSSYAICYGSGVDGGYINLAAGKAAGDTLRRGFTSVRDLSGPTCSLKRAIDEGLYDPIDVSQYTETEFRAVVEAAENWGTYVTVHAYTPRAIQTAIRAGVKCIDHDQLMDEPTAQLTAEQRVWLSLQPFLDNEFSNPHTGAGRAKQLQVFAETDTAYALAKKYQIKIAWSTDILFEPKLTAKQGAILATMVRWYTPAEVLW